MEEDTTVREERCSVMDAQRAARADTFLRRIAPLYEAALTPFPWLVVSLPSFVRSWIRQGQPSQSVCFDEQLVDEVPTGTHDVPMDIIVTPSQVILASSRASEVLKHR
jgi:hypothetical protein